MATGNTKTILQALLLLVLVAGIGSIVYFTVTPSEGNITAAVERTETPIPGWENEDVDVCCGTPDPNEWHGIPYEPYKNNGFNQATYEARLTANPTYTLGNFDE
jgi:hypothetical protein